MTIEAGGIPATPTQITGIKTDLGLHLVDNTSDASKPISTAQATALALKVDLSALSELIDDRIAALLVAGANVTITYNDVANTLTIASTGGGGGGGLADGDYGDVTVSSAGTVITIDNATITLAKMANLAQDQVIGRVSASTGIPETFTVTAAARTVLDDASVSAMVDTLGGAAASGSGGLARVTAPTLTNAVVGTQAGNDNSTKAASTAYADAKVANDLTSSTSIAPSKTAVNTAFALKADLASPTFTGTPSAPTAAAATSTTQIATTAMVQAAIDAKVAGLMDIKGSVNCTANPNYPAASVGDAYIVTGTGRIGGASGKLVDVGDWAIATADNAGGAEASVGTSWAIVEHNINGMLLAANNLSDVANAGTARTNLGLVIGTDVQAQDTTLAALAGLTISANSVLLGTGADAFSVIALAANKFLARSSSGNAAAKDITDFALSLLDDADAATALATLGAAADLAGYTLGSGTTAITHATHANRVGIVNQAGATTGTFAATATSGAVAKDSFYLRNTGAGTFTASGTITAPTGFKLTALPNEVFTADYDSVDDAWYSTTPVVPSSANAVAMATAADYAAMKTLLAVQSTDISNFAEAVDDRVGAALVLPTGAYDDAGNAIRIPYMLPISVSPDESTALTTGTGKVSWHMPFAMTLTGIFAGVTVAPTGSTLTVDVNEAGTTLMSSAKLVIDATEFSTHTAATPPVLTDTAIAKGALMSIDVDQVGSTTAGAGLKVYLVGFITGF
jgi:hypothetical protein